MFYLKSKKKTRNFSKEEISFLNNFRNISELAAFSGAFSNLYNKVVNFAEDVKENNTETNSDTSKSSDTSSDKSPRELGRELGEEAGKYVAQKISTKTPIELREAQPGEALGRHQKGESSPELLGPEKHLYDKWMRFKLDAEKKVWGTNPNTRHGSQMIDNLAAAVNTPLGKQFNHDKYLFAPGSFADRERFVREQIIDPATYEDTKDETWDVKKKFINDELEDGRIRFNKNRFEDYFGGDSESARIAANMASSIGNKFIKLGIPNTPENARKELERIATDKNALSEERNLAKAILLNRKARGDNDENLPTWTSQATPVRYDYQSSQPQSIATYQQMMRA